MIKSRKTLYKGISFRSRLEARYACFFDELKYDWVYEPFDLPGWIPDFLVQDNILIEIKPYTKISQFQKAIEKSIKAKLLGDSHHNLLFLGVQPIFTYGRLGWLLLSDEVISGNITQLPYMIAGEKGTLGCADIDLGKDKKKILKPIPEKTLRKYWANACNTTQWKPRKKYRRKKKK